MVTTFLGLGANLGSPPTTLAHCLHALDQLPYSKLVRWSRPWHTPPWGETEQNEFLNLAVELHTGLAPLALLRRLLDIETRLGRQRNGQRWGPRLIDIDLLLYGQRVIQHKWLKIPHPHMQQRAFVLCPLVEIHPQLVIPQVGLAQNFLRALDTTDHQPAKFNLQPIQMA